MMHSFKAQTIFKDIKEFIVLLMINFKVKIENTLEYVRVVFKFYSNVTFLKIDTFILLSYLLKSPFRISRQFLFLKGEKDIYTYGETPLTTMSLIADQCQIKARDTVYEMGCGRGRTCFWLQQFIGCKVVGIDFVPLFIQKAQKVVAYFNIQKIEFRLEDIFQTNIKKASVIYLYGTCYSSSEIDYLIERFRDLAKGTKIITISYSLSEFQPEAPFKVIKKFAAPFTWGNTDVYLQIKWR